MNFWCTNLYEQKNRCGRFFLWEERSTPGKISNDCWTIQHKLSSNRSGSHGFRNFPYPLLQPFMKHLENTLTYGNLILTNQDFMDFCLFFRGSSGEHPPLFDQIPRSTLRRPMRKPPRRCATTVVLPGFPGEVSTFLTFSPVLMWRVGNVVKDERIGVRCWWFTKFQAYPKWKTWFHQHFL